MTAWRTLELRTPWLEIYTLLHRLGAYGEAPSPFRKRPVLSAPRSLYSNALHRTTASDTHRHTTPEILRLPPLPYITLLSLIKAFRQEGKIGFGVCIYIYTYNTSHIPRPNQRGRGGATAITPPSPPSITVLFYIPHTAILSSTIVQNGVQAGRVAKRRTQGAASCS